MNILIFGSSGFIGKQVTARLHNHTLITPTSHDIDFTKPDELNLDKIKHLLQNIDVVINMVGVMASDKNLMENIHHITPFKIAQVAKAQVAKAQGVNKWINLSALGANPTHEVAFVGSKGRGDAAILNLNDEDFRVKIAHPSLVFGQGKNGGTSTELFLKLAKLPMLILPNGGDFAIQPVIVADVAEGLVNLALDKNSQELPPIINFTGEKVMTLAEYLVELRLHFYQKNPPHFLNLPMPVAKFSAKILQNFSDMVSVDSLTLLENGNVADNADFVKLLGRQPNLNFEQKKLAKTSFLQ